MNENKIIQTQDGSHSIFSQKFGESYHSKYGAIRESMHVFIEAGLYPMAIQQKSISILEVGFGTGLNAFLTFLEAEKRQLSVFYEGIEAYPLSFEQAKSLNYPLQLGATEQTAVFEKIHELSWETTHSLSDSFKIKKSQLLFEDISYKDKFDLIFFDAFAPNAQPELWDIPVLSKMYDALLGGGVLVTYCAKGIVKRRFKSLGFKVEALPGPPGKREMTKCIKL